MTSEEVAEALDRLDLPVLTGDLLVPATEDTVAAPTTVTHRQVTPGGKNVSVLVCVVVLYLLHCFGCLVCMMSIIGEKKRKKWRGEVGISFVHDLLCIASNAFGCGFSYR